MVPLLLKPRLHTIKNSLFRSNIFKNQKGRYLIITATSALLMFALYRGAFDLLSRAADNPTTAMLTPSVTISVLITLLLTMLLFSNAISALSSLFLSHDIEMILASPLRGGRFFVSKICEIGLSSSWMVLIFGTPLMIAYAHAYHASLLFFFIALITLIPLLAIPSALALIGATLFARIVPASRTREIMLVCLAGTLLAVYLVFKILIGTSEVESSPTHLQRVTAILAVARSPWNPASWVGLLFASFLDPQQSVSWLPLVYLYALALTLALFANLVLKRFHHSAYSKAKSSGQTIKLRSNVGQKVFRALTPFLPSPYRAFIAKEYKMFCRDMAQAVQLMLLIGICMIYLYNFKVLHGVDGLPEHIRGWWQAFLILSNLTMGAFVLTAVSTRFVFPSVSFEGNSFWVVQASPISIHSVMRAKFLAWLVPLCLVGCVIFGSGALAIDAEPHIVALNIFTSCFLCYGIVGLAVGLGAFFANFSWEHSSQISASFGSLVYMLAAALLIFLDFIPTCTLLAVRTLRNSGVPFSPVEWYLAVSLSGLLLLYINLAATRWAFALGEASLKRLRQ